MPVKDLAKYGKMAAGSHADVHAPTGGSPGSNQVRALKRPAETTYTRQVPEVPEVQEFSRQALRPGNKAMEPPKDGGRAAHLGPKQPKVGTFKDAKHPISGAEMY